MSETSGLLELARIAGRSKAKPDPQLRRKAIEALASGLKPRLQRQGVGDLLGVVLVLSARTRRMALPKVAIDIDVFTPGGGRALRMFLPNVQ